MVFVSAFSCEVKHIAGVGFVAANPICDVFSETAANLRIVANNIVFSQ